MADPLCPVVDIVRYMERMISSGRLFVSFIVLVSATQASADSFRVPALKQGQPTSIQAYGHQNPACIEWTDGCVICASHDGHARCSTPGIACTPAGLTCKRLVPAKTTP